MSIEIKVARGNTTVTARVWFDDQGVDARGWYADYVIDGDVVDDSEKVGHEDMPTDIDAEPEAIKVARAHARRLATERT